jgi:hypothetical protein
MRSKVFSPLIGSSTLWMRLLLSRISMNLLWFLEYGVFSFRVLVFHSHAGRLKSPATIRFEFAFLLNPFRLFSSSSRGCSFEVLGL